MSCLSQGTWGKPTEVERLSYVFVREEEEGSKKLGRSAFLDRLALSANLPVGA